MQLTGVIYDLGQRVLFLHFFNCSIVFVSSDSAAKDEDMQAIVELMNSGMLLETPSLLVVLSTRQSSRHLLSLYRELQTLLR